MIDDPAAALEILLEELRRQKSAGVRRVHLSDESMASLLALAGKTPTTTPTTTPSPASKPSPTSKPSPATKPAVATPATADAPVFTLPAGTRSERMLALRQLVDACSETRKHLTPPQRALLGHGSLEAQVVFVGEAPSLEEMEIGQAFAGASGELLLRIIGAAGLVPADCYLVPVMGWRPEAPTAYGKRPPTARELAFSRPYLRAQIAIVEPRIVVALGAQAFEALHGRTPTITQARGQWFDLDGIPLLPTYHPNYLLHNPSATAKRAVWEDFLGLLAKLGRPISDKQRAYFAVGGG